MVELTSMDSAAFTVLQVVAWANVGVAVAFVAAVIVFGACCGIDSVRNGKQVRTHGGT